MREITFREAISEATVQMMDKDPAIFIMGAGVEDPKGVFDTTTEAFKRYKELRVFEIPLSENAVTGIAVGAALDGMHPLLVHARNDFLLLTMDQIVNNAAKWSYMTGGRFSVPLTIRAIIGRGWGQAAQHSQSLQALFAHIPGLKVVMPSGPYEAKGLLTASLMEKAPVIFLEHRWLYEKKAHVPNEFYSLPLGQSQVIREGRDITLVATSFMVWESRLAASSLAQVGIEVELIDPMTLSPLDLDPIVESVKKTGRLVIVDTASVFAGIGAEIAAAVNERAFGFLKGPVRRIGLPHVPTPCSQVLEEVFYPTAITIEMTIQQEIQDNRHQDQKRFFSDTTEVGASDKNFQGPF